MSKLVVDGIPARLHKRLKEEAAKNNRSVDKEVRIILSAHLRAFNLDDFPPPRKLQPPPTNELLAKIKRGDLE